MGIGIKRGECVGGNGGTAFRQTIADEITNKGVTTYVTDTDSVIVENLTKAGQIIYNNAYNAVTIKAQTFSQGVVTSTLSNGVSGDYTIPYSENGTTFTLTPTGDNSVTKTVEEGYYKQGVVTADGTVAYAAGVDSVTLVSEADGRTVTATASNGKTSSASIALGTDNGNHTFTLTPTDGTITVTKDLVAGYYEAGTITADGATAYEAGVTAGKQALSGSVSCTGSYSGVEEDGKKAVLSVSFTATAKLSGGVLTVSCSSSGKATAYSWSNNKWTPSDGVSYSGSGSKSNKTTLA